MNPLSLNESLHATRPCSAISCSGGRRQQGYVTLAISIIILFMMTFMVLYSGRVGFIEQRISGNEYRAERSFANAEFGLQQGYMLLNQNKRNMVALASSGAWAPCNNQVELPCGNGVANWSGDEWQYIAGLEDYSLATASTYGDFELYLVATNATHSLGAEAFFRFIAKGISDDETGEAVVMEDVYFKPFLGNGPPAPLMAAGSVDLGGNFAVVANPNASGTGVPLSIWATNDVEFVCDGSCSSTGSGQTCQLGDWLATGTPVGYNYPDSSTSVATLAADFLYCDITSGGACDCPAMNADSVGLLSGKSGSDELEGVDILDVDNHADGQGNPDDDDFPSDMFVYFFGKTLADFLADENNYEEIDDCSADLTANTPTGIYVVDIDGEPGSPTGCSISNAGGMFNPIILIINDTTGGIANFSGGEFYGFLFTTSIIRLNGNALFNGAVAAQGAVRFAGGTNTIRYDEFIINLLRNSPGTGIALALPGSWRDSLPGSSAL